MSALIIVAALAQAGTASAATAPATASTNPNIRSGETNYVDLEAGVGYSSNPNLTLVNDQGAAFGRLSIYAVHSRVSARSTTLLSAYGENVSYTNHHSSQQSASISARHDAAVSEHVRLFIDGNALYTEGGQLDTRVLGIPLVPPPVPGGIITPPIVIPGSGDFLSVRGREYNVAGHIGGSFALGPRDSLSLSSGVEHNDFRGALVHTHYTTIPVTLAYDRQLSARSTIGARIVAQDTEYNGPGGFRVITPQLTAQTLLSPTISLDGAIGVSFARTDNGVTVHHSTGLAAAANLCGHGEASYFCARFNADEQAATAAGPARTIGGGIDYTRQLDADQSISFSLGMTHYSTPLSVVTGQSFSSSNYYRAAASYARSFAPRLFGGINLAARKVTQNGPDPKTDLNGSLFIRYRFGDL